MTAPASETTAVTTYPRIPPAYSAPPNNRRIALYPDLLAARVDKYRVILPDFAPVFDRLFVYPLDDADQTEKVGSIVMPTTVKSKHGAQRGLFVMAGARAHEELYSHGIELGHILVTARLAPWERQYATPSGLARVLVLRASDVVGSEDVHQAYQRGELWLERDASTGRVELGDRSRVDPPDHDEGI